VKSQLLPLQVGSPCAGTGQALHIDPHELVLSLGRHTPLQSCLPPGHWPMHEVPGARHLPKQSTLPPVHSPPHMPFGQVALPPSGGSHGLHDWPQVAGSVSETQALSQAWKPGLQVRPQVVPSQVAAIALAGTGQGSQRPPQVATARSLTHALLQLCLPTPQPLSTGGRTSTPNPSVSSGVSVTGPSVGSPPPCPPPGLPASEPA
jgi:hypothetical protein